MIIKYMCIYSSMIDCQFIRKRGNYKSCSVGIEHELVYNIYVWDALGMHLVWLNARLLWIKLFLNTGIPHNNADAVLVVVVPFFNVKLALDIQYLTITSLCLYCSKERVLYRGLHPHQELLLILLVPGPFIRHVIWLFVHTGMLTRIYYISCLKFCCQPVIRWVNKHCWASWNYWVSIAIV